MIIENIMGSHWYSVITSRAAPPGRMNENWILINKMNMPIKIAHRLG